MRFSIEQIVLWPQEQAHAPRVLRFQPGKVNVVTGRSKTGKSAILPIIDYCMCSGECRIPSGVIRQKTAWYGIVVDLGGRRVLLARRDPGRQQQTGDMMIVEGESIQLPAVPKTNASADTVKEYLNKLAGLPSLELDSTRSLNRYAARPSFRDMTSFVFQPQWIVSNPNTLFFKADTTEHREKLRAVLPLVIGALAPEDLALQEELRDLRRDRKRLALELESREAVTEAWKAEVAGQYSRLRELSMFDLEEAQSRWKTGDYVARLRTISEATVPAQVGVATSLTIERSTEELERLKVQEEMTSQAILTVRYRLEELHSLAGQAERYNGNLSSQLRRVAHVGWFTEALSDSQCPFCGSTDGRTGDGLSGASTVRAQIEGALKSTKRLPAMYDKELTEARRDLEQLEQKLRMVRREIAEIVGGSESLTRARYTRDGALQLLGQVRQSLTNWDEASVDGTLAERIAELDGRIHSLESRLSEGDRKARMREALRRVSESMQRYARQVQVENPEDGVELLPNELTVRVLRADGTKDLLSEIGSGANWMGYHLAALLALHEFFCARSHSPVPALLVLDQPSQVYFPERWPEDPDTRLGTKGELIENPGEELSRDLEGVHSIFETLVSGVAATDGELQVIVMDHADEITWRGLERGIHLSARWREREQVSGDALVPQEWLA